MAPRKIPPDLYEFERMAYAINDFTWVCGVDEAGRGPLAGPVFAAAVILPKDFAIEGLNDSKKLSEKKREFLYEKIVQQAVAYQICMVDEKRDRSAEYFSCVNAGDEKRGRRAFYLPGHCLHRRKPHTGAGNSGDCCDQG